jgi:phosphoglycolate phosphatase
MPTLFMSVFTQGLVYMHLSFDFDYTLADSSKGTIQCANYALACLGYPESTNECIADTIGLSLDETYNALVKVYRAEESKVFAEHFLSKADEVVVDSITFYQHTKPTLEALKTEGHMISIVSTKYSKRINAALERDELSHLIDFVIGGDLVSEPKPSPEGLELAVKRSSIPKHQTIYIGDSKSDGLCAQRADVQFIAVLTGTTGKRELSKYQPVAMIENVSGLLKVLKTLTKRPHRIG